MAISGGNEINSKISSLIEGQFSDYIKSEGPALIEFLEAYYEYMEQQGKAINAARKLKDNQDIDRTVDEFVEYFRKQFLIDIPKNILADKRLLIKHIREFYRSKGSQKSFKLLFRILFDDHIEFMYPGERLMRVSDSKWVRETVIRVAAPFEGNPYLLEGRTITGSNSNAKARVERLQVVYLAGIKTFTLITENVSGRFEDFEEVYDDFGNRATVLSTQGGIRSFRITDGGAFNLTNDPLRLIGESSGDGTARATVKLIEQSIDKITIKVANGGSGYRPGHTFIYVTGQNPEEVAAAQLESITDTSYANLNVDIIDWQKNVVLNCIGPGPGNFGGLGQNTHVLSSTMRVANMSSTLAAALKYENSLIGSINAISILSPGAGYASPYHNITIRAIDEGVIAADLNPGANTEWERNIGQNAVFVANTAPGAIAEIEITEFGTNYLRDEKVTMLNQRIPEKRIEEYRDTSNQLKYTQSTVYTSNGIPTAVSGIVRLPGRYVTTNSLISSEHKIQDSEYWQEFSYVIKSRQELAKYSDVVKQLLHVAGTRMFAVYETQSEVNLPTLFLTSKTTINNVIIREAINANTSLDGSYVEYISNINESVSTSDEFIGVRSATGAIDETVSLISEEIVIATMTASISESVSLAETFGGTLIANVINNEAIVSSDTNVVNVDFVPAVSESATSSSQESVVVDFVPAVSETLSANSEFGVEIFQLMTGIYAQIHMANSQIDAWDTYNIAVFDDVPIQAFDDTVRLVRGAQGTPTFLDGNLVDNTTNLILLNVGDSWDFSTLYTTNTVYSNSVFTIKTSFPAPSANATISYAT